MRLFSIMIFKCGFRSASSCDKSVDSIRLAQAIDLSDFGFFKRNSAHEIMTFFSRNVANRSRIGDRLSVANEEYIAHVSVTSDKLACVILTDKDYPNRVAFDVIKESLAVFSAASFNWQALTSDTDFNIPKLELLLKRYQKPEEVDKLLKIQRDVDDVKAIMYKNIEDMMERGERLSDIVAKSDDLSRQSKTFVTQSKKMNGCCK